MISDLQLSISETHYLTSTPDPRLLHPILRKDAGVRAARFFKLMPGPATHVVLAAKPGGQLIGWLRMAHHGVDTHSLGIWVSPWYRRQGVGMRMWDYAIAQLTPACISMSTVTRDGSGLARKLMRTHPAIAFNCDLLPE